MSTHVPKRTCVGCREVDSPTQMVRVVRVNTVKGVELAIDRTNSAPGRGAWIHIDRQCATTAFSRGGFARSFKNAVDTARLEREFEALTALARGTEPLLEAG